MMNNNLVHSYSHYFHGILGLFFLAYLIYMIIYSYLDLTLHKILIIILGLIIVLFLNKKFFYNYKVKGSYIIIGYPLNIFGERIEKIELKDISTIIFSPGGARSGSGLVIKLKGRNKRYHLNCSTRDKEKLANHFVKFGLKFE